MKIKRNIFKKIGILFLFIGLHPLYAQSPDHVEMADNFRGEGKIYIVIGIILLILTGFFLYLFRTEQRLKKLEKKKNTKVNI
jgi:magnesium-transporting ATPase (P-type)